MRGQCLIIKQSKDTKGNLSAIFFYYILNIKKELSYFFFL